MQYALRSNTGSWLNVAGQTYNNVAWHLIDESAMTDEHMDHHGLDIMHVTGREDPQLSGHKIFGDPPAMPSHVVRPAGAVRPVKPATAPAAAKPAKAKAAEAKPAEAKPAETGPCDEFSKMKGEELRAKAKELGLGDYPKIGIKNSDIADAIRAHLAANPPA